MMDQVTCGGDISTVIELQLWQNINNRLNMPSSQQSLKD